MFTSLTLFGRSLLLLTSELLVNAICWIVAGILFGRKTATQPLLSLALLSWTIGLRHALDADHISAIDNATRGLIALGQLPVTCGLFFSLGHSTIVIVVVVAIAISSDIYDKIHRVGSVGAIVGAAVSGSFLFLVGLANSILLWRIIKKRRQSNQQAAGENHPIPDESSDSGHHNQMLMMRILGPILTVVDRPWKMFPVGVLFGLGFDTASSIALLAVSAIAKKDADGNAIPAGYIVILPFLFTAGMTLIDSLDSILMLYSYSGFPERGWAVFILEKGPTADMDTSGRIDEQPVDCILDLEERQDGESMGGITTTIVETTGDPKSQSTITATATPLVSSQHQQPTGLERAGDRNMERDLRVKRNMMSGLSIVLTLMSILVAFGISLITIMALIGHNCRSCREAAEAEDGHGGGLAGKWWRGWATANDNSGFIGAAIVGTFILVLAGWYGGRWCLGKYKARMATQVNNAECINTV